MHTWDPDLHPRWLAGTGGSRGGEFRAKWERSILHVMGGIPTYRHSAPLPHGLEDELKQLIRQDMQAPPMMEIQKNEKLWNEHLVRSRRVDELRQQIWDVVGRDQTRARVIEQHIAESAAREEYFSEFVQRNNIADVPAFQQRIEQEMKASWRDAPVAIRVTPADLARVLTDGRFKTVHETRGRGYNDPAFRARYEEATFGYAPEGDPEVRPVYGYLSPGGLKPAGAKDQFAEGGDALSQYGRVAVVLKPHVRQRTTAMYGDAMDMRQFGMPSQVDNPSWQSYTFGRGGIFGAVYMGTDRTDILISLGYIEAQIHGGVRVSDIERVVFPSAPPAALRVQLEAVGIPWEVLK